MIAPATGDLFVMRTCKDFLQVLKEDTVTYEDVEARFNLGLILRLLQAGLPLDSELFVVVLGFKLPDVEQAKKMMCPHTENRP